MSKPSAYEKKDTRPRLRTNVNLTRFPLTPADMFVVSRIDGQTCVEDLSLISGFPEQQTAELLQHLDDLGVLRPTQLDSAPKTESGEDCDLDLDQRRMIDEAYERLGELDLYGLLGCEPGADRQRIRRAYAEQAKRFHPDRYFGKRLGLYGPRLAQIFAQINAAFAFLQDDVNRAAYEPEARRECGQHLTEPALPRVTGRETPVQRDPCKSSGDERARQARGKKFYEQALEQIRSGNTTAATSSLALAISFDPQNHEYAERLSELREQVATTRATQHARQAETEEVAQRYDLAAEQWALAAKAHERALYHRRAADAYLAACDVERAKHYALAAARMEPKNCKAHMTLARTYASDNKVDAARKELEIVLGLDPEFEPARALKAKIDESSTRATARPAFNVSVRAKVYSSYKRPPKR